MPARSFRWCAAVLSLVALWAAAPARASTDPTGLPARADAILAGLPAQAVVVLDASDGTILYGRNEGTALPVASLMKMLTALVVAERLHPDDTVTIMHAAAFARDDQIAWRENATFTADQVLHGMLMESSNGAAIALAQRAAGSLKAFARLANARAVSLGAADTNLIDPSGLDAGGQHSSARDLALIADAVLRNTWLAHVVVTKDYAVPWPDGTTAHFGNLDRFVTTYPGAVGVKNGFTSVAGNCVAAAASRNGKTAIVVVLNTAHVYETAAGLMDATFASATLGSWTPDPLPAGTTMSVPPSVESVRALTASKTRDVAAAPAGHHPPFALVFFLLGFGYVSRVVQVRRRKVRRRRAQRRARAAATRAQLEHRYAIEQPQPMPGTLVLRERPRSLSGSR
ncbi:MAG: D-alanyl-D-alanine carboxypeptidase family protein [Actinomycetota bacterium]